MSNPIIDQTPHRVDLKKCVGDDVVINITVKENGVAVPTAEMTVTHGLVTSQGDAVSVTMNMTQPVDGSIVLKIAKADTTALGKGKFIFWCSVLRNSVELTYVNGTITLQEKWEMST